MESANQIPIRNLYYLLLYAWNRLEEGSIVNVEPEGETDLLNLLARIILAATRLLLRRGLDRGYRQIQNELRGIRGKINFNATIARQLPANARACCDYDELDYQVLHNRILKTTIAALLHFAEIDAAIKAELADLNRRLHEIEEVSLCANLFSRVHQQQRQISILYGFLMDVCELVFNNRLVSDHGGTYRFREFIRDESRMPQVFEDFLRNFYKIELEGVYPGFQVMGSQIIRWELDAPGDGPVEFLPVMKTDISIKTPDSYLIIDAKYYKKTLSEYYNEKIHSAHLYQLYAYLRNLEAKSSEYRNCQGILLYPTVQHSLELKYNIQGHSITIKTIDLARHWRDIHNDLLHISGALLHEARPGSVQPMAVSPAKEGSRCSTS